MKKSLTIFNIVLSSILFSTSVFAQTKIENLILETVNYDSLVSKKFTWNLAQRKSFQLQVKAIENYKELSINTPITITIQPTQNYPFEINLDSKRYVLYSIVSSKSNVVVSYLIASIDSEFGNSGESSFEFNPNRTGIYYLKTKNCKCSFKPVFVRALK
jgi:hypothetical protein